MKRSVIIDNDGGVDDAWAIFLLLNDPTIEVLALTCVYGNTSLENVCANNVRLLAQLGRNEIPVYKGADFPLMPNLSNSTSSSTILTNFHGRNGFGDVALDPLPNIPKMKDECAAVAINSLVERAKGEMTLVCLGPLTNIALTVKVFPQFSLNVKEIFVMGGNYTAQGNSSIRPEFNIHQDPEAADIVFNALGGKMTVLPWETCRNTPITLDWKKRVEENCGPAMKFLHTIEKPLTDKKMALGLNNFVSSDVLLAVIVCDNEAVEGEIIHKIGVETTGKWTTGQLVVLDHLDDDPRRKSKIIEKVSSNKYMKLIESLCHL